MARKLVRRLRLERKAGAKSLQRCVRRQLVRRWYSDMLEKRLRMMNQQGGGGKENMPEPILKRQANKSQRSAAPPGPPGPQGSGRGPPGPPINAGGVNHKIVEELNMQLDSVRELYYNERASQMALSNLVREVQELREPDSIRRRIKSLQVASQLCSTRVEKRAGVGRARSPPAPPARVAHSQRDMSHS